MIHSLEWNEDELMPSFLPSVRRFVGEKISSSSGETTRQASLPPAKWREVPMPISQRRETDLEHVKSPHLNVDEEHTDFLEHSLAILQELDSCQIEVPDGTYLDDATRLTFTSCADSTTLSTDVSLQTSDDSLVASTSGHSAEQVLNYNGPVTDLKRIPGAQHLQTIQPQTMTVNVLASIIAVQPARTVKLRKRNGEMDIIEVLLGDETRAGFTTNFWLPPIDSQAYHTPDKGSLRPALESLRPGDILLITNIALEHFKGHVYGQSLSRRITRNHTSVTMLSETVVGLSAPVAAKMHRVRGWSAKFIGRGTKRSAALEPFDRDSRKRHLVEDLPPDTQ